MTSSELATNELRGATLALIAGGRGTRMGKPKAWLRIGDESILSWMLHRLQWPGPTMLVTAPSVSPPPESALFGAVVTDPADGQGPLRGVLTALENAKSPIVVAIAVDMPLVDRPYLAWLVESLEQHPDRLGLMGRVTDGDEQHIEPFPGVYRTEAAAVIADELAAEQMSVQRLCRTERFLALPVPPTQSRELWTNLNDPAQFAAFEQNAHVRQESLR